MSRRFMPVAMEKAQRVDLPGQAWEYEDLYLPVPPILPLHFIFNPQIFQAVVLQYYFLSSEGRVEPEFIHFIEDASVLLERGGPAVLEKMVEGTGGIKLRQIINDAFNSAYAMQFAAESEWRHMGRNILEIDPLLMDALLKTEVNVLPEDFRLPISPLYIALPKDTLSIASADSEGWKVRGQSTVPEERWTEAAREEERAYQFGDPTPVWDEMIEMERTRGQIDKRMEGFLDVDGFLVKEIDYAQEEGTIFTFEEGVEDLVERVKEIKQVDVSRAEAAAVLSNQGAKPGDYVYLDPVLYPLGPIVLQKGYTRWLTVLAYTDTPPSVSPLDTEFLWFALPLDFDGTLSDHFKTDERLLSLLRGRHSPNSVEKWIRAIFNPLLYFFSQGADKEKVSGLTAGQEKRLERISSKKQRKKFIEKHKSPFSIIKLGSSFSHSPSSGLKRGSIDKRFVVRGHWRMQRHGPGLKQVKTVWIKPHIRGKDKESQKTSRIYRNPYY